MELSFVGEALELDDNSYYLTTSGLLRAYYSQQSYIEIDGEAVKLRKENHPAEFIVGKKMDTGGFHTMDYTVAGVIDLTKCNPLIEDVFPDYFARETFVGNVYRSSNKNAAEIPEITIQFGDVKYNGEFQVENRLSAVIPSDGKILTENGLQELDEVTLADDEIALSYAMYAKMFEASPKWSYISTDFTEVISMPEQIGQSFSLKFYDYETGELILIRVN